MSLKPLILIALPLLLAGCGDNASKFFDGGNNAGTPPSGSQGSSGGGSEGSGSGGSESEGSGGSGEESSGGSGGEGTGGGTSGGSLYAPIYADGSLTNKSAMMGDGLSGFYTRADGSIGELKLRLSEDGKTVYVSLDGGAETAWSTRTSKNANGGTWTGDGGTLTVGWKGAANTSALLNGQSAVYGLETPSDSLPLGEARYNGAWSTNGGNGAMKVTIDFDSGLLGGGLTGAFAGMGGVDGAVSGTVDGSRINGTIALTSNSYAGIAGLLRRALWRRRLARGRRFGRQLRRRDADRRLHAEPQRQLIPDPESERPALETARAFVSWSEERRQPRSSTISTRCGIEFTMPRTEGVSSSSRVRCILFSPSPISVRCWTSGRRIGEPICLMTMVLAMIYASSATRLEDSVASSRFGRMSATFLPRRCATDRGEASFWRPFIVARIML